MLNFSLPRVLAVLWNPSILCKDLQGRRANLVTVTDAAAQTNFHACLADFKLHLGHASQPIPFVIHDSGQLFMFRQPDVGALSIRDSVIP